MDFHLFLTFCTVTALIILSPGACAILVASKVTAFGLRGALVIGGFNLSAVAYFTLSALGLTAIIVSSQQMFLWIKWIGVAYLLYLAFMAIFTKSGGLVVKRETGKQQSPASLISQGFLIEFSNPKAWLYFAAVLPPFIDPSRPLITQVIIMIAATIVMQWIIYMGYALLADGIVKRGIRENTIIWLNRFIGGALLLAAIKIAKTTANQ